MFKRISIISGIVLLIVGLAAGALFLFKNESVVYEKDGLSWTIEKPRLIGLSDITVSEKKIENAVDIAHQVNLQLWGLPLASYEITERTLGNGTRFVFEKVENEAWLPIPITTSIEGLSKPDFTDWNPSVVEHPYHNDFGVDPTVNPFGAITHDEGEMLQGNVFISKELEAEYENQETSRLRELDKEVRHLEITGDSLSKDFWLPPNQIAESWSLLSDEELFTEEQTETEWIDFSLNNQTMQLNWLTAEGPYTKLPFSIEPNTKMGYGRAMGRFEDEVSLEWNERSPSVFFESMVLNSRINLLGYLEEFDGTRWPTEYTSTWLKNAYGVTAPYVDTRFNEYVAFYLDNTAELYDEEIQQEELAVGVYADYLLSRIEEGEIIEAGDGLLIIDYFDEDSSTPLTHASLNHELGGLKILLTAYQETAQEKYLEAAKQVILGIEQFGAADGGWIRDTGDLWYQARPDGTFSGDDYPQLTLVDLLETQNLFEEMGMERNAYFDEMIDAKLDYLESEGIELIEKVTNLM